MALYLIIAALCVVYAAFKAFVHPRLHPSSLSNLPGPSSVSWFMGNLGQLFNRKGLSFHHGLVERFGGMVKVYGFFGHIQLYVADPLALQTILVKEGHSFDEPPVFLETNKIIFGEGLVATAGAQHKRQRKVTNPVFSVTHLRELTPIFYEVADKLCAVISKQHRANSNGSEDEAQTTIDMAEWMSRVALETVGRTILDYSFDPLDSPHNNPYTSAIKELIPTLFSLSLLRQFAPFLARLGPPQLRRHFVEWMPIPVIQKVKNMSDVMYNTARGILQQKLASVAVDKEQSSGRDIISALLKANNQQVGGDKLTEDELIGQMTVLIFGAQDTTSSALSRMLYMLALHPEVQERLRAEIRTAVATGASDGSGHLDYAEILALPWLDAIVKETLRLYPPVPFVRRVATASCVVPLSTPVHSPHADVAPITSVVIPEGTILFVGIAAANRLESVWGPDAKEWKPTRWLAQEQRVGDKLPSIYSGMLTFLAGERACIGYKFAQIEMKILLATLVSRFSFATTQDEVVWNLSQIISPSVRVPAAPGSLPVLLEKQGLPLLVNLISEEAT